MVTVLKHVMKSQMAQSMPESVRKMSNYESASRYLAELVPIMRIFLLFGRIFIMRSPIWMWIVLFDYASVDRNL